MLLKFSGLVEALRDILAKILWCKYIPARINMPLISEVAENVSKGHLYTTPVYSWNLGETATNLSYNLS